MQPGQPIHLRNGDIERQAGGKTLAKADGPFEIVSKPSDSTAALCCPMAKTPLYEGRPQAIDRIVRSQFPLEWLQPGPGEAVTDQGLERVALRISEQGVLRLRENDIVVYEDEGDKASLLIVDFVHAGQKRITGRGLTPVGSGPWSTRLWQVGLRNDMPVKTVVDVGLDSGKLTAGSIENIKKGTIFGLILPLTWLPKPTRIQMTLKAFYL